jgi:hypothetical protein
LDEKEDNITVFVQYVEKLKENSTYGDYLSLLAMAEVEKVDIWVISSFFNNRYIICITPQNR